LVGDPLNDFNGIVLLAGQVFINHQAFRVPVTAHIRPYACIATGREPRVVGVVADGDTIAFSVRDELQNCRDRLILRVIR
jgi:hypothetical protein